MHLSEKFGKGASEFRLHTFELAVERGSDKCKANDKCETASLPILRCPEIFSALFEVFFWYFFQCGQMQQVEMRGRMFSFEHESHKAFL